MLASGALSPLRGFMGTRRLRGRRRGHAPRRRHHLGAARDARGRRGAARRARRARRRGRHAPGRARRREVFAYDAKHEAELCFRTTEDAHPGVARLYGQPGQYLAGEVTVFERPEAGLPRARARPRADARRVHRARLEARRRVPDAQPDPPRARVRHEGRARGRRRHPHPPAGRRDEGRRRPAAVRVDCYHALLDNYYPADRTLLSALPRRHALRRAARGRLARDLPQELRLLALHRRPRPRRRRQLLRHLRRAADLRRARRARRWASSR